MLREGTAEDWPDSGADSPDRGHQGDVLASLAERDEVTDNSINKNVDTTAADALDSAAGDDGAGIVGAAGHAAADGKDDHGADHHPAAAEDVGRLAEEREDHRRRQDIRVGDPHVQLAGLEIKGDGGQRRRQDGRVQGRQEGRDAERREDGPKAP